MVQPKCFSLRYPDCFSCERVAFKRGFKEVYAYLNCNGNINIEYAYSSAVHVNGKIALILRASDVESAERMLKENGAAVLTLDEIKKYFQ